ncbi:dihydroorotase, partial [Galdieria sulphuraria]
TYEVPTHIRCIDDSSQFVPFLAGETLHWKIHNQ